MGIKEYGKFYHVDISTQIENKWKNDSVLAIVKDLRKYSIKIRAKDKEEIKRRFILNDDFDSAKKHNKKIVSLIYSYILYKALCEFPEAKPLLLCRDVRPERFVEHYLEKVAYFFKNQQILDREIKFRKRIEFETKEKLPKSLAGKYARKVYQKKLLANKILDNNNIKELIEIIGKIL